MTLTRRALFKGMGAGLLMAPSIVRASSLDYVPRAAVSDELTMRELIDGATEARRINAEIVRIFSRFPIDGEFQAFTGYRLLDTKTAPCLTAAEI